MNAVLTVMIKELVDMFQDRRTVVLGVILAPMLFPLMFLGMNLLAEYKSDVKRETLVKVPVLGAEHAPELVEFLKQKHIEVLPPPSDPDAAVRAQTHEVILRIAPGYAEQWQASASADLDLIFDSSRMDTQLPLTRVRTALEEYSAATGEQRLVSRGINPEVYHALRITSRDVATPEARSSMLVSALLPYILIISAFLGGSYLVVDITAGERERQSLEPLLATPASRTAIMSGKIAAASIYGLLTLVQMLVAFKLSLLFAGGLFGEITMSWTAVLQLLVVLMPMLLIGTALLTIIAASVKSVKEAQAFVGLMMMIPMLPTLVLMMNPVKDQLWMFAVPFVAQNQVIVRLVRSETVTAAEWVTCLGAALALGMLLWAVAAHRYQSEKLAIST